MFKSKAFQYCAIAAAVVATSGVIWASNINLKSQSPSRVEAETQAKLVPKASPDLDSESLAELPDRPDQFSKRIENPEMPSGRVLKQLNLSAEQLQKLKAIRDRDSDKLRALSDQSRLANRELRELLDGTESNDVIRAKHDRLLSLQQELRKQHFERALAMREILTPQQRSQLKEIIQKNRPMQREGMRERLKNRMDNRDKMGDRSFL
ncbi:Spy/CpxP family protein refolding chaperone [Pseudanabaena biceps]|nr:Spy/CpxP family protein refolding chaperone [Pseudanabaena biceps]